MGYGTFDVSLSVPEGWLISGTGTLTNAEEVLSDRTIARLEQAALSRDVVAVVTEDERGAGSATVDSPTGRLSWRFYAEDVRDFAFGTSDKYVWDATHASAGENTISMIHALYRPDREVWKRSAEFTQFTIEYLSEMFAPYPYAHMSAVEGISAGWNSP